MKNPTYKLFVALMIIVLFLEVMHFFPKSISLIIHNRFNLNGEANVPTWYSTVLLFSVSLSSFGIFRLSHNTSYPRRFWLLFSGVYCYLSMDEAARLHELINRVLHVKWVFVYAPFAGAFFMACVYYLFKSKNRTLRNWIIGGLVVFATGGMGLELMKYLFKHQLPFRQYVEFAVEEGLEMIGTIMVLTGCIQELNRLKGRNEMLES